MRAYDVMDLWWDHSYGICSLCPAVSLVSVRVNSKVALEGYLTDFFSDMAVIFLICILVIIHEWDSNRPRISIV